MTDSTINPLMNSVMNLLDILREETEQYFNLFDVRSTEDNREASKKLNMYMLAYVFAIMELNNVHELKMKHDFGDKKAKVRIELRW